MHDKPQCSGNGYCDERAVNILRRFGLKETRQRKIILEIFLRMEGHPSTEEIHEEILRQGHRTGIATIYRLLQVLVQAGIVRTLEFGDGHTRYEYRDDSQQHLHFVCTTCGRIFEVPATSVNNQFEQLAKAHAFFLHNHTTYLYGVCDRCLPTGTKAHPPIKQERIDQMGNTPCNKSKMCTTEKKGYGPTSFRLQDPERVFQHLALQRGMLFVDAGCGAGDYSLYAARILGEHGRVIALDTMETSIQRLGTVSRENGCAQISAHVCDITDSIPVEADSVDIILLSTVLHIKSVRNRAESMFTEFKRTLRAGGTLAVLECKKEEADFGPPLHSRLSVAEVEALARPCGFKKHSELTLQHTYLACFKPI